MLDSKYEGRTGLLRESELSGESIWWRDLRKACGGKNMEEWFDKAI